MAKLSNSAEGKSWLNQFQPIDRPVASLLLDSLLLVSNAEFIRGLDSLIRDMINKGHKPIALFAAREKVKGTPYFPNDEERPLSVAAGQGLGSEGDIAHLCRDLANKYADDVLDHPSINQMRRHKCRKILAVDDISGSGKRLIEFAEWIYEHKTIKSWASLGYTELGAAAYGVTQKALARLKGCHIIHDRLFCQEVFEGRYRWQESERRSIEKLCRNYAKFTSRKKMPLGYDDTYSLLIFSHSCPNNTPAILWADKDNSWDGLFPRRLRPDLSISPWTETTESRETAHKKNTLISHEQSLKMNTKRRILRLIARGYRNQSIMSDILNMPMPIVGTLIDECEQAGWLETNGLTQSGRLILAGKEEQVLLQLKDVDRSGEFYYPSSYRGPAEPSS